MARPGRKALFLCPFVDKRQVRKRGLKRRRASLPTLNEPPIGPLLKQKNAGP